MRTREDQQRLKELLKDTITLLCKNGLQFKDELSVEALIGITLDQDNVFLVNIKETVQLQKNGNASESSDASDNEESNKNERLSSPRSAKKRPHSSSSHTAGITPSKQQRLTSGIRHGNKGLETIVSVKTEIDNEDDNDDEDLVFVKEEQHSHNAGQLSSPVGGVYPVSFGSSVINMGSGTSMSGDLSMHNKSNTSLDSSAFLQHSPGAWGGTKTSGNQQATCSLCMKSFQYKQSLQDHLRGTHNIGGPIVCNCGMTFNWRSTFKQHKKTCEAAKAAKQQQFVASAVKDAMIRVHDTQFATSAAQDAIIHAHDTKLTTYDSIVSVYDTASHETMVGTENTVAVTREIEKDIETFSDEEVDIKPFV